MVYATTVYVPPALPPCIAKRFSDFLRAIGKPLAGFPYSKTGDVTFRPKDYRCWRRPTRYLYTLHAGRYDLRVASYGFTYGLTTYEDITKKGFWIPKDSSLMATARLGPFPDYNNTLDVTAYACFGIKHGKGWYFYACGYGSSGVSPDTYAKCVSEALRGTPSGGNPRRRPVRDPRRRLGATWESALHRGRRFNAVLTTLASAWRNSCSPARDRTPVRWTAFLDRLLRRR